jgi:hypothetical protein
MNVRSVTTPTPSSPPLSTVTHHTLDSLARLSYAELEALYRAAAAPISLRAVDGALRGRMLAVKGLERGPIARWARRWAGSPAFVWDGKTFAARDDGHGDGHNRVSIPRVLGRQNLFPFETRLDRSELDALPTVVLDYDLAVNPPYIRKVHDEIRELSPGLFLGPAMWKARKGPVPVLWFALDARAAEHAS